MEETAVYHPQTIEHPGFTLKEKLLELAIGPKEFALRTNKPEQTISAILKGKSGITADMSVQFETVTKIPAEYWLRFQSIYDEAAARTKRKKQLKQSERWIKNFPLQAMVKAGWIEKGGDSTEALTENLLNFFGVSCQKSWENYYCNQKLKVAFSISLKETKNPFAVSAWLRKGEIDARKLLTQQFDEVKFNSFLYSFKVARFTAAGKTFVDLQNICLTFGVKLIHTPLLPNTMVKGAMRWVGKNPVIQLSENNILKASFWTSFIHESAHIILHGKKDVFIEGHCLILKNTTKEKEAIAFTKSWIKTGYTNEH